MGNVGDARAVLCRAGEVVALTVDHKPTHPAERERIERAGGWIHNRRLHGVLAVARAFGDVEYKSMKHLWGREFTCDPLIAAPDVRFEPLRPEDEFLVLACDGVWDVMTNRDAVNFVRRRLVRHGDVQRAARELQDKAGELHSNDNISVVVVCLNQKMSEAGQLQQRFLS